MAPLPDFQRRALSAKLNKLLRQSYDNLADRSVGAL
jgi:hypothetical protein